MSFLFSQGSLFQIISILCGFVFSYGLSYLVRKVYSRSFTHLQKFDRFKPFIQRLIFPISLNLVQWTIVAATREFSWPNEINQVTATFFTAWFSVRLLECVKMQPGLRSLITGAIYGATLLNVVGLLPHLIGMMESFAFSIGELHLSLLSVLKGGTLFLLLLWGTNRASRWIELKIKKSASIAPSNRELFTKLIKVAFVIFSILISLSSSGINLSAFAIFGGAIGVGIGFGLQKVVSNFICGIILLLDRSIKPGDIVALDQGRAYGEINKLGARCVTVRTPAGKEHLIPNEDFITQRSENWSHSDRCIRLSIPMRAGLDSDVDQVLDILVQAAQGVEGLMDEKPPGARIKGFSESAIEFDLLVWIQDPHNGVSKVSSNIYLNIWRLFKQHGIKIPHAQQDVHVQTDREISALIAEHQVKL